MATKSLVGSRDRGRQVKRAGSRLKVRAFRGLARFGLLRTALHYIESYRALDAKPVPHGFKGLPVPLPQLMVRVAGHADAVSFLDSGQDAARSITGALESVGVSIHDLKNVLDFGCGCGRVLRNWQGHGGKIYGCDLSEPAIIWCRDNLPFGRFDVNGLEPPLSYADSTFDLIYALSVFTHLPVVMQFAWRDELCRVLRPGGYLLLTLHGDAYLPQLSQAERAVYESGECVVRWAEVAGSNLCGAYHPVSFVRERLTDGWELLKHVPRGALGNPEQDLILLRKPGHSSADATA